MFVGTDADGHEIIYVGVAERKGSEQAIRMEFVWLVK